MSNKKVMENTLLAVLGIGLITTAVVLLSKRAGRLLEDDNSSQDRVTSYDDYEEESAGLHVFSETGILL